MKTTILTTTLYRSVEETRFHLACQMIGNAVAMNYNVVVFDASPSVIREAFQRIENGSRFDVQHGLAEIYTGLSILGKSGELLAADKRSLTVKALADRHQLVHADIDTKCARILKSDQEKISAKRVETLVTLLNDHPLLTELKKIDCSPACIAYVLFPRHVEKPESFVSRLLKD